MTVRVLSHREASPESVRLAHLVVSISGEELSSPEFLPAWDYGTSIGVRVDITVDLARCLSDTGLGSNSSLAASLVWHASGSGLRGASSPTTLVDGLNSVRIEFEGQELGGTLALLVVVTLSERGANCEPLAAVRPGSLLWSTERRVRLEGRGSRFPISTVSFATAGIAAGLQGAWAVVFDSWDLFDSGAGNVRLYLNSDHPKVEPMLEGAEPESPIIAEVLHADVNRQIVLQGLEHEDLDLTFEYPTESMGELLAMAVRRNFPDRSLEEIRSLRHQAPGEFEAHLQARIGFLT